MTGPDPDRGGIVSQSRIDLHGAHPRRESLGIASPLFSRRARETGVGELAISSEGLDTLRTAGLETGAAPSAGFEKSGLNHSTALWKRRIAIVSRPNPST